MDLRTFIFEAKITITRMARDIGCSQSHLASVIKHRVRPSKLLAHKIQAYTRGLVSVEALLGQQEDVIDSLQAYLDSVAPRD